VSIVIPIGGAMYLFSYEIMYGWTGNHEFAGKISSTFGLYALGNVFLAINSFGYFLQYAKGNMRMHVIGNIISVLFYVPLLYYLSSINGSLGAGIAWLAVNLIYFIFWMPKIHSKLIPGLNATWYINDIGKIGFPACIPLIVLSLIIPDDLSRVQSILSVVVVFLISFACAIAASPYMRETFINQFRTKF
jgi:O-antigen/teichoic acid export membrane protein